MWKLSAVYIVPLLLSTTGIVPNNLQDSLKMLSLRPGIYTLNYSTVIHNTYRVVPKILAE